MPTPKNKSTYWAKRRAKARMQLFGTPRNMYMAALSYREWCRQNPVIVSGAAWPHPFTIPGLCFFIGCSASIFDLHDPADKFAQTIRRVKKFEINKKLAKTNFIN